MNDAPSSWLTDVLEHASERFTLLDAAGRVLGQSPSQPAEPPGELLRDYGHPDDAPRVEAFLKGATAVLRHRLTNADGSWQWFDSDFVPAPPGEPAATRRVLRSRAVHGQASPTLGQHLRFYETLSSLSDHLPDREVGEPLFQAVLEGAVAAIPGAQAGTLLQVREGYFSFVAAVGYDLATLRTVKLGLGDLNVGAEDTYLARGEATSTSKEALVRGLARQGEPPKARLLLPVRKGETVVAVVGLETFEDEAAFTPLAVAMARLLARHVWAVTGRLGLERDLERSRDELDTLAYVDAITGLANHQAFLRDLRTLPRTGYIAALDIDNFRYVNDTWGHATGDLLLRDVAARLEQGLQEGDRLARWSGDEFLLYLADPSQSSRGSPGDGLGDIAQRVSRRLQSLFRKAFRLAGRRFYVSLSGGVVPLAYAKQSNEALLTYADAALGRAKQGGKNTVRLFTFDMVRALHLRQGLEKDLREALRSGDISLHHQPLVDVRTAKVVKLEALARWTHEERGAVSPDIFIPQAEESGLITELGNQLLGQACAQLGQWRRQGVTLPVAFNLSAQQLGHPDIVRFVGATLEKHGVPPQALELELTESTAMHNVDQSIERLQGLRELGLRLAVDDFGVAYSSLAYLKKLPLDSLKIDRSFIAEITEDPLDAPRDASIVRAIVAMAQSLDLTIVAEGVETESQLRFLKFLGCHVAQGYYFSAPLPATDLVAWLKERIR